MDVRRVGETEVPPDAPSPRSRALGDALEQLERVFARAEAGGYATLAVGAAFAVPLAARVPVAVLAGWLAVLAAVAAARIATGRVRRTRRLEPQEHAHWHRLALAEAAASGLVWGLAAAYLARHGDLAATSLAVALSTGALAIAAATHARHGVVHAAHVALAAGPPVVVMAMQPAAHARLAALVLAGLAAGAVVAARGLAREVRDNAALRRDNRDLEAILRLLHERDESRPASAAGVAESLWRATLDAVPDGVILTDTAGVVEYLNPAASTLIGVAPGEATGRELVGLVRLVDDERQAALPDPVSEAARTGTRVRLEESTRLLRWHDDRSVYVEVDAVPLVTHGDDARRIAVVLRDVNETRVLGRFVAFQSTHDPMTGLLNRRELEARLNRAVAAAADGARHALCYLDLDHLDMLNDICGHPAGDALLRQVAAKLRALLRGTDTLARVGGDEFAALLTDCPLDDAVGVARNLHEGIRELRFPWGDRVFEVSAAVGVAGIDARTDHFSNALSAARTACHVAREQGGDRVRVYREADSELFRQHDLTRWVQALREAVAQSRFQLLVQPITPVDERRGLAPHGELLVRMLDEHGELVAPHTFLAAAERFNLMPAVDRWVLENTFAAMMRGTPSLERLAVCTINLSGQSLSDPDLLDFVSEAIAGHAVPPHRLCFEITETAVIENLDTARRFIVALKRVGCRFALDDFGSGMSSYGYLKHLPVDYLKIDGSFVRGLLEDQVDRAVVESINQIGHGLGMLTVAEHVETPEILERLREIGVDLAQGSAVGDPVPVD